MTQVRQALGLTRKAFAWMTGFSERALAGWESGSGKVVYQIVGVRQL